MQQLRVRVCEAQDLYATHSHGRLAHAYACARLGGTRGSKMYGQKLGKYMQTATKSKPPTNDPQWTMAKDDSVRNTCQTIMQVEPNLVDRDIEIEVYDELNLMKSRLIGTTGLIDLERTKVFPKTNGFFHPGDRFDFELRKDGVITGKVFVEFEWIDLPMSYVKRMDASSPPVQKAQCGTPETQTPTSSPETLFAASARSTPANSPVLSAAPARSERRGNVDARHQQRGRSTPEFQTPASSPTLFAATARSTPANSPVLSAAAARSDASSNSYVERRANMDAQLQKNGRNSPEIQTPANSPAFSAASARSDTSSRSHAERQAILDAWVQQKGCISSNSATTRSNAVAQQTRSRSSSSSSSGSSSSRSSSGSVESQRRPQPKQKQRNVAVPRNPHDLALGEQRHMTPRNRGCGSDVSSNPFGDLIEWSNGFSTQWNSKGGGFDGHRPESSSRLPFHTQQMPQQMPQQSQQQNPWQQHPKQQPRIYGGEDAPHLGSGFANGYPSPFGSGMSDSAPMSVLSQKQNPFGSGIPDGGFYNHKSDQDPFGNSWFAQQHQQPQLQQQHLQQQQQRHQQQQWHQQWQQPQEQEHQSPWHESARGRASSQNPFSNRPHSAR